MDQSIEYPSQVSRPWRRQWRHLLDHHEAVETPDKAVAGGGR